MKTVLVWWFFVLNHKDIVYVECLVQVQTSGSGSVLNCGKQLGKLQELLLCEYNSTWTQHLEGILGRDCYALYVLSLL